MLNKIQIIGLLLAVCHLKNNCYGQEKLKPKFGNISLKDFDLQSSPVIDSNTNAVIVYNIGSTHFIGNKNGGFSYVFKKQVRIKIINRKSFNLATIRVPLYVNGERGDKLDELSASTYNLEDGKIIEVKLDKSNLFEEKLYQHLLEDKFTMPAVKEGSIIEYTYTITSPVEFNIPAWEFQSEYAPCLWSEYNVIIPQVLLYVFVKQGLDSFFIDKGEEGRETYILSEKPNMGSIETADKEFRVNSNTVVHQWVMKEIKAFQPEIYLYSASNYIDKMEFQLSKYYDGDKTRDVMNTWKTATEEWLKEEDFGEPIQGKNNWMNEMLTAAVGNVPGQLEQAKSVYYYVENHFNCTNFENPYIKTGLHEMPKKGEGSVGDINLLLIAMLRKQGIKADPVLLSTRDHGFSYVQYPVVNKFNYVIVRAVVEGNVYFLDAAHRNLGFGKLMENCYNGHARIISEKDSASVYFWPDSLREKKITMVQIMSNEKGVLEGNYQSILGNSESLIAREKLNEIGQAAYFKNIQTTNEKEFEIRNTGIDSFDKLEEPVKIYYDFRLKTELGTSIIYINPMFTEALSKNPFNSMERIYPVEMPYIVDEKYILNMDIPPGYTIDELPKSATVTFNGNQGFFEYSIRASESHIQLRCVFKLIKTNFLAKDYNNLRDLFAFMIKKENELIVLKKNNK